MFKKGTGYSKACLVWLMLAWRFIKKDFIENCYIVLFVSSKDFKLKSLATIDPTLPNCLEKELVIQNLV